MYPFLNTGYPHAKLRAEAGDELRALLRRLLHPREDERYGMGHRASQRIKADPYFAALDLVALSKQTLPAPTWRHAVGDAEASMRSFSNRRGTEQWFRTPGVQVLF